MCGFAFTAYYLVFGLCVSNWKCQLTGYNLAVLYLYGRICALVCRPLNMGNLVYKLHGLIPPLNFEDKLYFVFSMLCFVLILFFFFGYGISDARCQVNSWIGWSQNGGISAVCDGVCHNLFNVISSLRKVNFEAITDLVYCGCYLVDHCRYGRTKY